MNYIQMVAILVERNARETTSCTLDYIAGFGYEKQRNRFRRYKSEFSNDVRIQVPYH